MKKMLVVYYSWSNGNTKRIAEQLTNGTGADIARIETTEPYSGSHEDVVEQGKREVEAGFMPQINPISVNLADYDVIAIGTPTWWYTMAPAVLTFLTTNDFTGKTVIPFMTNGGWPGHVIKDMEENCKGAAFAHEMQIQFDSKGKDHLETSEEVITESLVHHFENAKAHRVTQKEIAAVITHIAFYAGWPKGWAAFNLAKDVWSIDEGDLSYEDEAMRAHAKKMIFPIGEPNDKFAQYFTGKSFLAPVSTSQVGIFNVTFEPGCRNNWHIHHAKSGGGQILICIAGRGYYQEEGKEAVEMKPGDCVNIPAEVKHWHGAAPDEWFSHLAIEVPGEKTSSEWCEIVTDEIYGKLK